MQNRINREIEQICTHILTSKVKSFLESKEKVAYFIDPVLGLNRNRVNAELLKSLTRLEKRGITILDDSIRIKIINWLLSTQNKDGSWNEIHSNYDQPSALVTSFVGEALLMENNTRRVRDAVTNAKEYVLSQEYESGYFKKSAQNYTDCLNVNATCGAFLAQYAQKYDDISCLQAAQRAAHRVCYHQFPNGALPYTTKIRGYPYPYHLYVPCIHYQGVTLHFLSKIHHITQDGWIQHTLDKGGQWLASVQQDNGAFDWSKSGLMYAYYLTGAYAFATSTFLYLSQWNNSYDTNAKKALTVLEPNVNGIVNRWEQASLWSLPKGIIDALHTSWIGEYPLHHRLYRLGYGAYKQVARRRYSEKLEKNLFRRLSSFLQIESTWIEPSSNYPDLFNTSEVLDCLTYSLLFANSVREKHAL